MLDRAAGAEPTPTPTPTPGGGTTTPRTPPPPAAAEQRVHDLLGARQRHARSASRCSSRARASSASRRRPSPRRARRSSSPTKNVTVTKSGAQTITISLSSKAKSALRKDKKLKVTLKITYTPTGGTAKTITRTVTVKQPRRSSASHDARHISPHEPPQRLPARCREPWGTCSGGWCVRSSRTGCRVPARRLGAPHDPVLHAARRHQAVVAGRARSPLSTLIARSEEKQIATATLLDEDARVGRPERRRPHAVGRLPELGRADRRR